MSDISTVLVFCAIFASALVSSWYRLGIFPRVAAIVAFGAVILFLIRNKVPAPIPVAVTGYLEMAAGIAMSAALVFAAWRDWRRNRA